MTLEEWLAADKVTREEFERESWRLGIPRRVGIVAEKVAEFLAKKLAGHPEVTAVGVGQDRVPNDHVILMVTTSAEEGEKIAGIPDEFEGFPVVQFGVGRKRRERLQGMEFILRAARIPEAEMHERLRRFGDGLGDYGGAYYIDVPERWYAELLVAAIVSNRLGPEPPVELRADLQGAIREFFAETDPARVGMDSEAISRMRHVLDRILKDYGMRLRK
jgi:hypothetical protein